MPELNEGSSYLHSSNTLVHRSFIQTILLFFKTKTGGFFSEYVERVSVKISSYSSI